MPSVSMFKKSQVHGECILQCIIVNGIVNLHFYTFEFTQKLTNI